MFTQIISLVVLINASHSDTMLLGRMKLVPAIRAQYPASQVSSVQVDANNYIRLYTSITARVWKDKMYLFPLPTQELQLNPNLLPQNSGW
jgi:hypothetical protein